MPAPTLQSLCMKSAIRHKKTINTVQTKLGFSYEILRPLLLKIDNPQQLRRLEESEPSLHEDTAELWRAMIIRDCPSWEKNPVEPKNPKNWYKLYKRVMVEQQQRLAEHSIMLERALEQKEIEKQDSVTTFGAARKQPADYKHEIPRCIIKRIKDNARPHPSLGRYGTAPKSNATNGQTLLEKARKEARDANMLQKRAVVNQRTTQPTQAQQAAAANPYRPMLVPHGRLGNVMPATPGALSQSARQSKPATTTTIGNSKNQPAIPSLRPGAMSQGIRRSEPATTTPKDITNPRPAPSSSATRARQSDSATTTTIGSSNARPAVKRARPTSSIFMSNLKKRKV